MLDCRALCASAALLCVTGVVDARPPCTPHWLDVFSGGGLSAPGVAMLVFDDGCGEALYVGGQFTAAGGTQAFATARWDGLRWTALPGIGSGANVSALAEFDADGAGPGAPEIHASGNFAIGPGPGAPLGAARWDGAAWQALGAGLNSSASALLAFGGSLYFGGNMTLAGGAPARGVAVWNGSSWGAVGPASGAGSAVNIRALCAHDPDGGGASPTRLFACGLFEVSPGVHEEAVAYFEGSAWVIVGISAGGARVDTLASFDEDGAGVGAARLFVGGPFNSIGGTAASGVAAWNGSTWTSVANLSRASGSNTVRIHVIDSDGSGPALHCAGSFMIGGADAGTLVKWNGAAWASLNAPFGPIARDFAVYDENGLSEPAFYMVGTFGFAGGVQVNNIARMRDGEYSPLGGGADGFVRAFARFPAPTDGAVDELIMAGEFTFVDGEPIRGVARRTETGWEAVGGGLDIGNNVQALLAFDPDAGGAAPLTLVAGGEFSSIGGVSATRIASWNGSEWSAMAGGMNDLVAVIATFDEDGAGGADPALFAGGNFTRADGNTAVAIARWTGTTWAQVGSGIAGLPSANTRAIAVYTGPTTPGLFAGGVYESGAWLRRWNGSTWSTAATFDAPAQVLAIAEWDPDGPGAATPLLIVGGRFDNVSGVPASGIAAWNGAAWSALGAGFFNGGNGQNGDVRALRVIDDDADGPLTGALYAGGSFTQSGSTPILNIARWSGSAWQGLGGGVGGGTVFSLIGYDADGEETDPESVWAGGSFLTAGGLSSSRMGVWFNCPEACLGDSNGDGVVNFADLNRVLSEFGLIQDCDTPFGGDVNGDGFVNFADLNTVLSNFGVDC